MQRLALIAAFFCFAATASQPRERVAPPDPNLEPVPEQARIIGPWSGGTNVWDVPEISNIRLGEQFYYHVYWSQLRLGQSYEVACVFSDADGKMLKSVRFSGKVTESSWNFWCPYTPDIHAAPGTWKLSMTIGLKPDQYWQTWNEVSAEDHWYARITRWRERQQPRPAQPVKRVRTGGAGV